ncbi:CCA tRNA nucleotidyltransferase [Boseongicola aestuarii]|uniref:CCA-adding enzyme n=1 Tax=Boseongicola aestuarii TaxID=1470561 RepID=A0A238J2K3_9RHOB|nr:CCA tRNA nucleotidyltransferase [Boseongicola aestuarii]SMX24959.1 CCA-adding enzyme [Boseongicola aestuarii]
MKRIDADWLKNAETQRVFEILQSANHQAFAVGGCVRNTLLGVPVNDIDIATSATPAETTRLAERAGKKAIPTGFDHGTVTVVIDEKPFEVTTFRRDVETDGRRAIVAFTDNMEEDARRRDFTMNAIYADASGHVHDPLGGMPDLLAHRVRFIENADERIKEDALRSLRFFRFHAQYGDPSERLDPDALSAISQNVAALDGLAGERIGAEMLKLLATPDPAPSLAGMAVTGALMRVLPGASTQWVAPLVHLEKEAGQPADALRRLATLGGDDPNQRWRLSRADARKRSQLTELASGTVSISEVAWRYGKDTAWSVVLIRQALSEQQLPGGIAESIRNAAAAEFPLKTKDLMAHHAGPALGAALRRAEKAWIESNFLLSRDALIGIALKEG